MKIMRVKDKRVGDVEYYKYRINLPKKIVEEGNFLEKELKASLIDGKIVIELIPNQKNN